MKVNGSSPSGVDALHVVAEAPARAATTAKAVGAERPVVDVSVQAQSMRAIDTIPPVDDDELVAAIRERISSGSFMIDYGKIAEAMLALGQMSQR